MANYLLTLAAVLALLSGQALASNMPFNKKFKVPPNPFKGIALIPDPPAQVINGPGPKEPMDAYERVYRCWGYLGKPEAMGWVKLFFINGTLPGPAVCRGVLNVHKDCWPDMFKVWYFSNMKRINHLGHHCRTLIWKQERLGLEGN